MAPSRNNSSNAAARRAMAQLATPIPSIPDISHHATKNPLEQPYTGSNASDSEDEDDGEETPLPVRQLLLLAFLSLAEQTALNSISPYLPEMVLNMPGIPDEKAGLYVGILASSFALAQLSTNFLWGYASDVIGRKPVLIMGTIALMGCFCVFGFCKEYWQIVVIHVLMGLLNGNAACVPTVLGEVTDRSNQSRAFTYLPVIYSLGSITGPALGGILVGTMGKKYPYLAPNILSAGLLAISVIVVSIWFEETLDKTQVAFEKPAWVDKILSWFPSRPPPPRRPSWSARWPRSHSQNQPLLSSGRALESDSDEDEDDADDSDNNIDPALSAWKDLSSTTILVLFTYLVFQLSNISFNSLYPIFAATPAPAGRDLLPSKIGVSLSTAGLASCIFQAFLFQQLKSKLGNLGTYQISLLGLGISMLFMPWVGYADDKPLFGVGSGKIWLYIELGLVLILKNLCAVGGLSSVMLLITNSAPSHASLGSLNGMAQTLSALGRSFGPFVSGGLFSLSINIRPKGEALAWSIFGGLAILGWVSSLFIRRDGLESDDWQGSDENLADQEAEEA
ncbi:putative membrane protein [Fusarium culmorum]|uniref:Putative membrane protein n=1 Tax=Fusarium culmorum TaxID=5516 RepID=A0A2T4HC46_FUSCU|nr:putative membrane protein [Fusarium culmorum]